MKKPSTFIDNIIINIVRRAEFVAASNIICKMLTYVSMTGQFVLKARYFLLAFFLVESVIAQPAQMDAGDLQLAVNKLSVLGSVLYVGAHPDDENTALLAYFAKGRLYRTAYLSITRGEGGQNLIGPEQGEELGLIRTQELLDARSIDGGQQFFTRAIDFGYCKSSEEALRLWEKDSVLKDVVWVIRKFRPDIIVTRFTPTLGGHGHHLASAILANEAFKISGDPAVYPEQLRYVKPWKAKRILFNEFHWGNTNANPDNKPTLTVDVGEFNPLLGTSYTELAGISRSMHKSQGMGASQSIGTSVNDFIVTGGDPAAKDIMEGVNTSWGRVENGKAVAREISAVQKSFSIQHPSNSVPALLKLYAHLKSLPDDEWVRIKKEEIQNLIVNCLGLRMEVNAGEPSYSPGNPIELKASFVNRSSVPVFVSLVQFPELVQNIMSGQPLKTNEPYTMSFTFDIPSSLPFTQPYFLRNEPAHFRYHVDDPSLVGNPETRPSLNADVTIGVGKENFKFLLPIQYRWVDRTRGELYRNVEIVPPVSVWTNEKNVLGHDGKPSMITITVKALQNSVSGTIGITVPSGWITASPHSFTIPKKDEESVVQFNVTPDSGAQSGNFTAVATINGKQYRKTVKTISYPHIAPQTLLETSGGKLLCFDLKSRGNSIGYIMGAGDQVPEALMQMGYTVSLVSDDELKEGNLNRYDAVIAGIRSYNTRSQLRVSNDRLLKYVEQGGTYIVQYQTVTRGETDNIAPYPMELSHDRTTDEDAAMTFLDDGNPVLNSPNKITQKDFQGWVQERGLYYPDKWDAHFTPVFSCADPNEKPTDGSLLIAKYGKGNYIFTGLAFFRQLPAGVEGAYRLFANLVSIGK